MQFQTIIFWVFVFIVFIIYWNIPGKYRWIVLLLSGYLFYASWDIKYTLILAGVTLLTYFFSRILEKKNGRSRKIFLYGYIFAEVSVLFIFKYINFFSEILAKLGKLVGIDITEKVMDIILPIGISFYIFQTIGYILDIYYRRISSEKHIGYLATSIAFFPILLAGPIERIPNLVSELKQKKFFSYEIAYDGFQRILIGLMKKMIIADGIAMLFVDPVYNNPEMYYGFPMTITILLYSVEIYCDFAGYSDLAIGISKLFGISICENFRQPYFSDSITKFWKRWHISLTSWFRDYIYIPLGGNRVSTIKNMRNIFGVYILSGLWHGANWTFLIWGGLNGLIQIIEKILGKKKDIRVPSAIKYVFTYLIISITWVFFRADSLDKAILLIYHSMDGVWNIVNYLSSGVEFICTSRIQIGIIVVYSILLLVIDICNEKKLKISIPGWSLTLLLALGIAYYSKYGIDSRAFIYFAF